MRLVFIALVSLPLMAQNNNWFNEAQLKDPATQRALEGLDSKALVDEWIRVTEIPAPSGKEQLRAEYVRNELQKLGLSDIRTDKLLNVSGVRKGTGGGPSIVFAAHLDTVFPEGTNLKVRRDGDRLLAPGIMDDTGSLVALIEAFRALNRAKAETKGDLIFLASTQEELGQLGAKSWLETSGYHPDLFVALDVKSTQLWYGAFYGTHFKFFYTSPAKHTLHSRGEPSSVRAAAKAISALYDIPLPPVAKGYDLIIPALNVGTFGGGTVRNAVAPESWFTVDVRSTESASQDQLETSIVSITRRVSEQEKVGFRMERFAYDLSKARPAQERLEHPLVQTSLAVSNYFRKSGTPVIVPQDAGSTDAKPAMAMGIPQVSIGVTIGGNQHQLEEYAEASSIVPGVKSLVVLALTLANH